MHTYIHSKKCVPNKKKVLHRNGGVQLHQLPTLLPGCSMNNNKYSNVDYEGWYYYFYYCLETSLFPIGSSAGTAAVYLRILHVPHNLCSGSMIMYRQRIYYYCNKSSAERNRRLYSELFTVLTHPINFTNYFMNTAKIQKHHCLQHAVLLL